MSWAARSASGRVVVAVAGWVGGICECGLESGEVVAFSHGGTGDVDKTVARSFLGVLVDETARVDRSHVSAVDLRDSAEGTGVGDATVLRKAMGCKFENIGKVLGGNGLTKEEYRSQ